ncbi:MAG: hypothetical protein LBF22_12025 [Deltaproteobacteria bacterium]|jgi:hypothetical protein|nr:hypothetical protein [Deltaproteobacteria bacterium]
MLNYQIPIGGLKINGQALYSPGKLSSSENKISKSVLKIPNGTLGAVTSPNSGNEKKVSTLEKNFANNLLKTLTIENNKLGSLKKHSDEENQLLVESISLTVKEVEEKFGKKEATRLMATIVTSLEGGVTEGRLVGGISQFFSTLSDAAYGTLKRQGAADEDITEAENTLAKLENMVFFLNEGSGTEEDSHQNALSVVLNDYFGRKDSPEEERRSFTSEFTFLSPNEIARASLQQEAREELEFYLTKEELGEEALSQTKAYLSETLGNAEAAKIIDAVQEGADIFSAVASVREYLSTSESEVVTSKTDSEEKEVLGVSSNLGALATEVVKSASQKALFDEFLNTYLINEVNRVIQEDEKVGSRFKKLVSQTSGQTVTSVVGLSLISWPGIGVASGVSLSIGYEKSFSVSTNENNQIEAKVSQKISVTLSMGTAIVGPGVGLLASGYYLETAKESEFRYTKGGISHINRNSQTHGSYLLSTIV